MVDPPPFAKQEIAKQEKKVVGFRLRVSHDKDMMSDKEIRVMSERK